MANEDYLAEELPVKGDLQALFRIHSALGPAEVTVLESKIRSYAARRAQEKQSRIEAKKLEKEKQANAEQKSADDVLLHILLIDINAKIQANNDHLALLERYHYALSEHLSGLLDGSGGGLNADGTLSDKEAEAAVAAYEERNRTHIDRLDPAAIQTVITDIDQSTQDLIADNEYLSNQRDEILQQMPELELGTAELIQENPLTTINHHVRPALPVPGG